MDSYLLNQVRQCQGLPTLPAVAVQVLDLVRNPNAHIPQLARLISKDPALASKILRTVNSSMYARPAKVSKLTQALSLLGLQTVRVLVLGFSLVRNLKGYKNNGFQPLEYWRRAIYSATAALMLAQRANIELQEEAFVAALLMDLGMLVLNELLADRYSRLHEKARSHADLVRLEEVTLQTTHAQVSGALAEIWGLPQVLSVPMTFHHQPSNVEDPAFRKLAQICYLAGRCADVFVEESPGPAIAELRQSCHAQYHMTEADCDALLAQISTRTAEIAPLFEITLNTGVSYEAVLRKANDSVIEFTLADQQQARQERQQSGPRPTADPLAGLADRGEFDAFLDAAMSAALAQKTPLALLMLEIDRLQEIDDSHSSQRGERVLKNVGNVVMGLIRPGDLAARYRGKNLVVALPGRPRTAAAALAEKIRRAISSAPATQAGGPIEVTVSLGVATLEPAGLVRDTAHLLKAADMALYAAGKAGGNCVRVFSGQPVQAAKPAA